jgi:hypothetical protein
MLIPIMNVVITIGFNSFYFRRVIIYFTVYLIDMFCGIKSILGKNINKKTATNPIIVKIKKK